MVQHKVCVFKFSFSYYDKVSFFLFLLTHHKNKEFKYNIKLHKVKKKEEKLLIGNSKSIY